MEKYIYIIHVVQKIKYHTYTITKMYDNINMNGTGLEIKYLR